MGKGNGMEVAVAAVVGGGGDVLFGDSQEALAVLLVATLV